MHHDSSMGLAEIQGLFGTVTVSERLIQKIWLRGDFEQTDLKTTSGKLLRIKRPGLWNLNEGPDFRGAQLELDGKKITGDVEIHFYENDWNAHGHGADRNFDRVILHVVLFPPCSVSGVNTFSGNVPESLVLLSHLHSDIESYAGEEVIHEWNRADSGNLPETLLHLPHPDRQEKLIKNARKRFNQKIDFIRKRLDREDIQATAHRMTLEVLGYRRNRLPMSNIATDYPAELFGRESIEDIFASQTDNWKLAGMRPANHPRKRLGQYQALLEQKPDWMRQLQAWGLSQRLIGGSFSTNTRAYRKRKRMALQRKEICEQILKCSIGGTRFDTLMIDALIPMLAVNDPQAWFSLWFHWFPGDMPDPVTHMLRDCDIIGPRQPRCNGWQQGIWQICLESGL